jgi:hypothetical protein
MRLLDLNRGVVLACLSLLAGTACGGGDFQVTGNDRGLSGTGGKKSGAGGSSADSGSSSGGTEADGSASGGSSGHGARGGTTGSGGSNSGGRTSGGGADAGSDGGAASGGSGNGGSAGRGGGGSGGRGSGGTASGGTASGGASTGGSGGTSGSTGAGGAAGAGAHPQFVKNYDLKCQYDSECTLVYQGNDVCSCDAQCANASISTSALNQWNADRQAMMCVALPCSKQNCDTLVASCGTNLCYARKPLIIDPTHYDQGCLTAADCTTIPTGEVCSPCQCSRGAVSTKGYQNYLKDKQSVLCSPGPVPCNCAPPPNQTLTCVLAISGGGLGKCTLTAAATTG